MTTCRIRGCVYVREQCLHMTFMISTQVNLTRLRFLSRSSASRYLNHQDAYLKTGGETSLEDWAMCPEYGTMDLPPPLSTLGDHVREFSTLKESPTCVSTRLTGLRSVELTQSDFWWIFSAGSFSSVSSHLEADQDFGIPRPGRLCQLRRGARTG